MAINWQDPEIVFLSGRALTLLIHLFAGVYFWEYLLSLDFDWEIIRGKRKLNLATAFYILTRYSILLTKIIALRIFNVYSVEINCQVWIYLLHGFGYASVAFASGLLYLRVCACSAGNPFVVWSMGAGYVANWAFVVYGTYHTEGLRIPQLFACGALNSLAHRPNIIFQFSYDLACLVLMLFFLLRAHRGGSLGEFLIQQGLLYFVCICVVYLLNVILISLNLNEAINLMPQGCSLFTTTVCATRMQRELLKYVQHQNEGSGGFGLSGATYSNPFFARTTSAGGPLSPSQRTLQSPTVRFQLDHSRGHAESAIELEAGYSMDKLNRLS
ncbi:hypothetical protein BKA62DRAFT_814877 [Auriculariales sp. MPI-PUGE-AT-0066]|nr:hypothetical protein BKA62DRAFT_814877 [Auriculariales sp. MPI-PUGE-AT-0066]